MKTIKATILADTVFKHGTTRSSVDLPPDKKLSVSEGTVLNVLAFRDAGAQHQVVTFDRNLGYQHKNTWHVFNHHIDIKTPQGNGDRRISGAGIDLIKVFEGLELQAINVPATCGQSG
ncbi:MAG: hypothetical protein AAFX78_04935 [Cyanobacteria bacterium J06638_20]